LAAHATVLNYARTKQLQASGIIMKAQFALAAGFAAALALSTYAFGADAPPAPPAVSTDLTNIPSDKYSLDPNHANVVWQISHMGFSTLMGRFDKIAGTLDFNSKKPEKSKLKVTLETASIDSKVPALDTHLKGEDFFQADKYPEIKFKSTKIEKLSDSTGKVTGDLTLHGVTKPITLDVIFHGGGTHPMTKKAVIGFDAKTTIKRSEFGMEKYVQFVGDDVTLLISAEFDQGELPKAQ
jgi:polyisoprenoid-binding protein YceI